MAGNFEYYDVQGAAAGGAQERSPEERQVAEFKQMVHAAESTNYDGDPEYYQQIKALAMQAGVPIKAFKTNPYRIAKAGLLSMADTMSFGLVPDDWYTPMNSAEQTAASIGGIAGMINPYGGPAAIFRGAGAVMKGGKMMDKMKNLGGGMGDDFMKGAFGKFGYKGGRAPVKVPPLSTEDAIARAKIFGTGPQAGAKAEAAGWQAQGNSAVENATRTASARSAAQNPQILSEAKQIVKASKNTSRGGVNPSYKPGNMGAGGPPVINPKILSSREAAIKAQKLEGSKAAKKVVSKKTKAETKASKVANKAQLTKDKIVLKISKNGSIAKSEIAKIQAVMKPKALKRAQKLKGKAKVDYITNWAKQNGIKIKGAGSGQTSLPLNLTGQSQPGITLKQAKALAAGYNPTR